MLLIFRENSKTGRQISIEGVRECAQNYFDTSAMCSFRSSFQSLSLSVSSSFCPFPNLRGDFYEPGSAPTHRCCLLCLSGHGSETAGSSHEGRV